MDRRSVLRLLGVGAALPAVRVVEGIYEPPPVQPTIQLRGSLMGMDTETLAREIARLIRVNP